MCIGIGAVLVYMGRKDQQLITNSEQVKELSSIVSELAKSHIGLTMRDQQMEEKLRNLSDRLDRLERLKS